MEEGETMDMMHGQEEEEKRREDNRRKTYQPRNLTLVPGEMRGSSESKTSLLAGGLVLVKVVFVVIMDVDGV